MSISADALKTLPTLDARDIEAEVRDGDLLLCSGNHVFSKLIRWATRSPWSHVALVVRARALSRVMVLESVEKIGVRTIPLSTFAFGDEGMRPYPGQIVLARHARLAAASTADMRRLAAFAVDQLGDPFAPTEVLSIAARIAVGSLNRKASEGQEPQGRYICSEYVADCMAQIGVHPPWDGRGFIAPCDFANDPDVTAIARVRMPTVKAASANRNDRRRHRGRAPGPGDERPGPPHQPRND